MIDTVTTGEHVCGEFGASCDGCPNSTEAQSTRMLDARLKGTSRDALPTLYLSGPMSGHDQLNFPAFNAAARRLRCLGFPVINPADFGADEAYTWAQCIARDCFCLSFARVIVLLPGWEASKGSNAELDHALNLNIPAVTLECFGDKVVSRYFKRIEMEAVARLDEERRKLGAGVIEATGEVIVAPLDMLVAAIELQARDAARKAGPALRPRGEVTYDDD